MLESKLSLSTSLLLSFNGLVVVFTILVVLALATIVIARLIRVFQKATPAVASASASAPAVTKSEVSNPVSADDNVSDVIAVLQGALSLESGIPVDQLEVVSIHCVSNPEQH